MRTMRLLVSLVTAMAFGVERSSHGAIALSLSSAPSDLSALVVGQDISLGIGLDSATPHPAIETMGLVFDFERAILGDPMVEKGPILGSDDSLAVVDVQPNSFTVLFVSEAGLHTSGEFFSLNFTVTAVGSGEIGITEVEGSADEGGALPEVILPVEAIEYTSRPDAPVPEPSSILVWLSVITALIVRPRFGL